MENHPSSTKLFDVVTAIVLSALFIYALLLTACATQKPVVVNFPLRTDTGTSPTQPPAQVVMPSSKPASPPIATAATLPAVPSQPPAPQAIPVPVVDYKAPEATSEPSPPQSPKDIQTLITTNNLRFEIHPQQDDYHGGAVIYNYVPNHIYQLFVAPYELTSIFLEPGEQIVNPPAAGDTSNFMVGTTYDIENGQQVQHVLVKAVYPGHDTTLSINTDRRSYTFHVLSYDKIWMPLVSFNYPMDFAEKMKKQTAEQQSSIRLYGPLTSLDFAYAIIPARHSPPCLEPGQGLQRWPKDVYQLSLGKQGVVRTCTICSERPQRPHAAELQSRWRLFCRRFSS